MVENLGILKISSTVSGALAGGAAASGVKELAMFSTCSLNILNASSERGGGGRFCACNHG